MADLNQYVENQSRKETADEIDENTQAIYRNDLMYLFFKLLMFVILGGVFYYLFKNKSPTEMISQIKEKASNVSRVVRDKMDNEIVRV